MTAQRWWVRMGARWLARIDGVNPQLQLLFLAMTGYGVISDMLIGLGYGDYVIPFLSINAVVLTIYTYLYNEGGVRNQVSRDRSDLNNNFSVPRDVIDDTLIGVSIFAAEHGRPPNDEELEAIEQAVRDQWEEYRDGIDIHAD